MYYNLSNKNIYIVAFTLLLACISVTVTAQQYDPFDGKSADFHVRLSRYFKSPETEKASRVLLLDSINAFKSDSLWNLKNLRSHLDTYESLLVSIERHDQYFRLRTYINNKDSLAKRDHNAVNEAEGTLKGVTGRSLLQPTFLSVTDAQLEQYDLKKYKFLLVTAKQEAVHNLSDHDEQLISKISDDMIDHLTDRYDLMMDNIKGDSITIGHKNYSPVDVWSGILTNPDSALRRKVSIAYYKAYDDHAEVLASHPDRHHTPEKHISQIKGFYRYTRKGLCQEITVIRRKRKTNAAKDDPAYGYIKRLPAVAGRLY